MEVATLAATVVTAMFSEAFKEAGKNLGKGVSEQGGALFNLIRDRFKVAGTEGILTRTEKDPNEKNITKFQDELETQLEEDEAFAKLVREIVEQLQTNETVKQIFLKGVEVKGKAKIGDINLEANRSGAVEQEAVVDSKFGDDLDLGNVNMKA
jgi:hypothetical protein